MRLRILLPLICILACRGLDAAAQDRLKINEFFSMDFQSKEGVTAVEVEGNVFPGWGDMITVFKSLKVNDPKHIDKIEKAVKQDATDAVQRTMSMSDGRLHYIWFALKPVKKDLNRYVIYVHRPDSPATLIYMEGKLIPQSFKNYILERYLPSDDLVSECVYYNDVNLL